MLWEPQYKLVDSIKILKIFYILRLCSLKQESPSFMEGMLKNQTFIIYSKLFKNITD
jgi:hypothetical protein